METFEPKWVNPNDINMGLTDLRFGGLQFKNQESIILKANDTKCESLN